MHGISVKAGFEKPTSGENGERLYKKGVGLFSMEMAGCRGG